MASQGMYCWHIKSSTPCLYQTYLSLDMFEMRRYLSPQSPIVEMLHIYGSCTAYERINPRMEGLA